MSRSILAGAACALWLAAGSAAAEPFQNFVDFCLDTNADREAAVARAKAAGWSAMPPEMMDPDEIEFRDPAVFLSFDLATVSEKGPPESFEILITGWGSGRDVFDLDGVKLDACAVMSVDGDHATLAARLGERIGFAPTDVTGNGEMGWIFSRAGRRFQSEVELVDIEDSDLVRVARERKLYVAGVLEEDGMTGLLMGALRPSD